MKNLLILLTFAVCTSASAEPFQQAGEERPFVCNSAQTAFDAWKRNNVSLYSAIDLVKSGECRMITHETKLRVLQNFRSKDLYYSQVEIIGEPPPDHPLFIGGMLNDPIDPEEQERQRIEAANKYPPGCSMPVGGQVNRMERGKDGQVYLKRYMITTKCVNGQMRSFTTPLD